MLSLLRLFFEEFKCLELHLAWHDAERDILIDYFSVAFDLWSLTSVGVFGLFISSFVFNLLSWLILWLSVDSFCLFKINFSSFLDFLSNYLLSSLCSATIVHTYTRTESSFDVGCESAFIVLYSWCSVRNLLGKTE